MHGYVWIVGVALVGILTRIFLLETFHQEDKVVIVEITNASSVATVNDAIDSNQQITKTDN